MWLSRSASVCGEPLGQKPSAWQGDYDRSHLLSPDVRQALPCPRVRLCLISPGSTALILPGSNPLFHFCSFLSGFRAPSPSALSATVLGISGDVCFANQFSCFPNIASFLTQNSRIFILTLSEKFFKSIKESMKSPIILPPIDKNW